MRERVADRLADKLWTNARTRPGRVHRHRERLANAGTRSAPREMNVCICSAVHTVEKMQRTHGTANRELARLSAEGSTNVAYVKSLRKIYCRR